ncbi:MAG: HDIG domain-containing metalloprotein [Acidimicrobiia bacterium]
MNASIVRAVAFVSTVALAWGVLVYGASGTVISFEPREIAERTYTARIPAQVLHEAAFELAQQEAVAAVAPEVRRNEDAERETLLAIDQLFNDVRQGVVRESLPQIPSVDPVPSTTTTTTSSTVPPEDGATTTTTLAPEPEDPATIEGRVFIDANFDAVYEPLANATLSDAPAIAVDVIARSDGGEVYETTTGPEGYYSLTVPAGEYELGLLMSDQDIPDNMTISTDAPVQSLACGAGETCTAGVIGLGPAARALDIQVAELSATYGVLDEDTIATLVMVATDDIVREAVGATPALRVLESQVQGEIARRFTLEINNLEELRVAQNEVTSSPPIVFIDSTISEQARTAVGDIVASFLRPNTEIDQLRTEELREAARLGVLEEEFFEEYSVDQTIIAGGEPFSQLSIDAIAATNAADVQPVRQASVAAMLAVLMASLAFYLSRFRRQFWESPRMVALFCLLIVMAAGAVRMTMELREQASWFILPAVAFGYLAAVLFDNRMGTLMSIALGILAATATRNPGVAVFAVLATLAPIGFVSRVSSRRAFRNSVVTSSLAVGVIAAAVAWLFLTPADALADEVLRTVGISVAWAIGAALIASLVALAAMPFFESIFDITTTLRLLEVIDRNHEGLQLLQEKAFGSFNHSLMVGTLADAAARSIDANNLLARAAAYYHDLGKTENPLYFIENQFGISNPHDDLEPEESAAIIRRHVTDGMALAKRHKIPSEVAEGIVTHHGDGIMRYFYDKAITAQGEENVDPDQFRHAGHKPRSKEMAILMMADAVEGACRAVFEREEPSTEAIEKVVTRVIDEKAGDGQLQDCDLTMGELTRVKKAFIEALAGHYHRRIQYPNFPGT